MKPVFRRVAQVPRSPDLAIFVLTTDDRQTTDKTDHITPCACARGKYIIGASLSEPHTNQYYEKIAVLCLTY